MLSNAVGGPERRNVQSSGAHGGVERMGFAHSIYKANRVAAERPFRRKRLETRVEPREVTPKPPSI